MKDYHINIFYSDENEGYIADIPELKHCSAFGNTPEEALKEVKIVKEARKIYIHSIWLLRVIKMPFPLISVHRKKNSGSLFRAVRQENFLKDLQKVLAKDSLHKHITNYHQREQFFL
jgi:hypothetical protein